MFAELYFPLYAVNYSIFQKDGPNFLLKCNSNWVHLFETSCILQCSTNIELVCKVWPGCQFGTNVANNLEDRLCEQHLPVTE